jgi:hypothetical protein
MMRPEKIGMIEIDKSQSPAKKVIYLIARCRHCNMMATRKISCPDDLTGFPTGTFVGINEFGRLEAMPEVL